MPSNSNLPHIVVNGFVNSEDYRYPKEPNGPIFPVQKRDRAIHGNRILTQLEVIRNQFELRKDDELPEGIVRDDAIYVEFESDWGFELKTEQLNDNKYPPKYQLLSVKKEKHPIEEKYRYRIVLMLTEGGISHFIKRVEDYLNPQKDNSNSNTPKSNPLIANIETIQLATLKAFWTDEPEIPFPDENDVVWWEVWFRKSNENEQNVIQNLTEVGAAIGLSRLVFAEHIVRLVRASAKQLSNSLMFLDNLAELRKPQEMNDFLTHDDVQQRQKELWLENLAERTENKLTENGVLVCLLDSGVNNLHPLLSPLLPNDRLYTLREDWGKFDSGRGNGHGTGMAGLALYGDLTDVIASSQNIQLFHGVESFKIFNPDSPNDPELLGAIYNLACATPFVNRPDNPRVFCLSVTNKHFVFKGRPSSSSTAIDQIAFDPEAPQLIFVSGGNVEIENAADYPNKNFYESIQDPAQAYNAVTVGSYTRKDRLASDTLKPLAPNGGMAPSNSTSTTWETQWPNKPDIVMEGGNMSNDGDHPDSLKLITTSKNFRLGVFQTFGDTSASVALASKMAAELRTAYPEYWPETIRGLMIHSAIWTEEMLRGRNLSKENDRRALLRSVGYGVPSLENAMFSANNSLTLIAQKTIKPYKKEGSTIKSNEYHLFQLPWPKDILMNE
ncbi:MAG: S8 family peptidase, partial [Cytophagales bacterium]|nr:S8 family peptidase [Cytophagales bacterium]